MFDMTQYPRSICVTPERDHDILSVPDTLQTIFFPLVCQVPTTESAECRGKGLDEISYRCLYQTVRYLVILE